MEELDVAMHVYRYQDGQAVTVGDEVRYCREYSGYVTALNYPAAEKESSSEHAAWRQSVTGIEIEVQGLGSLILPDRDCDLELIAHRPSS